MLAFPNNVHLVQSLSELPKYNNANELYLDFETTSFDSQESALKPFHGHRIAGICITIDNDPKAYYIPIRCTHEKWNVPLEPTLKWLRKVVGTCHDWVNHVVKFDAHFAKQDDIIFNGRLVDTNTLAKIIQSDKFDYGLDTLSKEWLNDDIKPLDDKLQNYLKGCKSKNYGDVPGDIIGEYGGQDVLTARKLYKYMLEKRHEQTIGIWETEIKLTPVLFDMEEAGMRVDPLELQKKELIILNSLVVLEEQLHKLTGLAIRPHTNEDCYEVLCNQHGLPVLGSTETGDPSFDKFAMMSYLAHPRVQQSELLMSIVTKIRNYRKLHTLLTFFVHPYQEHQVDGLMHPDYNQIIRTGRMSCRRPNSQQLSPEAKALVLPYPGYDFVSWDYCLPAGTLIPTPFGDKPIEKIANDLLPVLSLTHDNELKFCEISRGAQVGFGKIYRITFDDNSTFECTDEHPFLSYDGSTQIKCKDLLPGTRLKHIRDGFGYGGLYPAWHHDGNTIYKHRLAMEWAVKDNIEDDLEHVHHKNQDKSDWQIDNLELIDAYEHWSMHGKENYIKQDHTLRIKNLQAALKLRCSYTDSGNPNWQGGKLIVACEICGKPITCWPSQQKHYCSKECRSIGLSQAHIKSRVEITCSYCGKKSKVLLGRSYRKFCSRLCANRGTASYRFKVFKHEKNYCVQKVEYVRDDYFYTITVPETGCYVTTNGLVNFQSQIEFRILVHYIDDERAIAAYAADPDTDFHKWVAELCGIPRKPAKNVNFAIAYGGGKNKIVTMLAANMDLVGNLSAKVDELVNAKRIDDSQRQQVFDLLCQRRGEEVYNTYHKTLPGVRETSRRASKNLEIRGYVFNAYGRQRHLPIKASYRAFNTIMQSCAADVMKERLVAVAPRYNKYIRDLDIIPNANVHDELLNNIPHEIAQNMTVLKTITDILTDTDVKFRVPMRASCSHSSKNWADCSTDENKIKF